MPTIFIDDRPYEVEDGQNLLHACLSLGFDIPYFCWHPAMGSVGACRQCAVKQFRDENDKTGRIVMSCMTPAENGVRISIDDPDVRRFRADVIQWLMLHHPHDCPVCDEGGECHLQDMTVMTGHTRRRNRFPKRTHRNQDLGPFLNHEMNRCIQCYRCVRFYRDVAGGRDLNVFGSHHHVYFGRFEDGPLENPFSGNLVEICPTGVFTDKSLKHHYTRKWDLQTAPSICVHCSLGCNTLPGERYGTLRRIRNRYHHDINGYFLCDRGRYGYDFVNSAERIHTPHRRRRKDDALQPVPAELAMITAASLIKKGIETGRPVIGLGSPRASLEANFMLKTLVGADRFYAGVSKTDWQIVDKAVHILRRGPARSACLRDTTDADAVFLLGENVADTAPMVALNLRRYLHIKAARIAHDTQIPEWDDAGIRELVQHRKEALFIATAYPSSLDEAAKTVCRADPDTLARLANHVASFIDDSAPRPDLPDELREPAAAIARALKQARNPLIVSGAGCGSPYLLEAAANVTRALDAMGTKAGLLFTLPEADSLGLHLLDPRGDLDSALAAMEQEGAATVIVLENDLFRRAAADRVETMFDIAEQMICIDHLWHATTQRADMVLPSATFAESTGTLINNEGRAQRFFQVFPPAGDIQEAWRWVRDMMADGGNTDAAKMRTIDDVITHLAASMPVGEAIRQAAPDAGYRLEKAGIPRQSHRYSGRTAMHAHVDIHERRPAADADAPLEFSMEGRDGPSTPASLIPRFWAPGWNSIQSLNKFQAEVAGPLRKGIPGNRLIEPPATAASGYFSDPPDGPAPADDERFIVPIHHVFGSEELSMRSPGLAARAPSSYVALSPEDARLLGIDDGETAIVTLKDTVLRLPVRLLPGLAAKTAGLPVGLPTLPVITADRICRIRKEEARHA